MLNFSQENFQTEVLNATEPVLIDFWAPWCGPCRMMAPVVEELAADYAGRIKVGKINVDENPELSSKYGIMSIPTMCLFVKGELATQLVGLRPKKEIATVLEQYLPSQP